MSTFQDRMEQLMYEWHLNKSQIAAKLGVSPSTVHRWFSRGSLPDTETMGLIADVFGVSEKWLRGGDVTQDGAPLPSEEDVDEELVRLLKGLTPTQLQRVKDFLSGLRG